MSTATRKTNKIRTVTIMSAQTTTGAGSGYQLPKDKAIQIDGITTGTVKIQISNDNTSWYDLVTATADGAYETETPWAWLRANVTVATNVSVTVVVGYTE